METLIMFVALQHMLMEIRLTKALGPTVATRTAFKSCMATTVQVICVRSRLRLPLRYWIQGHIKLNLGSFQNGTTLNALSTSTTVATMTWQAVLA